MNQIDKVLFCAHRWEAEPFIEILNLTPYRTSPFALYGGESGWAVVVSGIGSERAAAAVASTLTATPRDARTLLVANFGIAGCLREEWPVGQAVLINQVRKYETNSRWYPDRLLKSPWPEAGCLTVPKPGIVADAPGAIVYEMEASGFFSASELYLPTARIAIGKVVSDHVEPNLVPDWREITTTLATPYHKACGEFVEYLQALIEHLEQDPREMKKREVRRWTQLTMSTFEPHFTVTQNRKLVSALESYALITDSTKERDEKITRFKNLLSEAELKTKSDRTKFHQKLLGELSSTDLFSSLH